MKKNILILLALVTLCAFTVEKKRVTIFLAGDSTMSFWSPIHHIKDSVTGKITDETYPQRGWGQMLPSFFNSEVSIQNFAKSGKSTLTFATEGFWQKIMDKVQAGDYVVIEFGHNDESKASFPRFTTPAEYGANLRKFVSDVRGKSAIPILCTPVSRRKFEDGKLVDTHKLYSDEVRKIAKEENVLFIDMQKKSAKRIMELGEIESKKLFVYIEPGVKLSNPKGRKDDTHFNELGATVLAEEFVKGLKELHIDALTKNLK